MPSAPSRNQPVELAATESVAQFVSQPALTIIMLSAARSQAEDAARKRLGLGVAHNLRVRAMHGNKALLEVGTLSMCCTCKGVR